MRTKKSSYTHTISTMVTTDMRNKIIELATEANISQGEFVRDAIEYYIKYLNKQVFYEYINNIKPTEIN